MSITIAAAPIWATTTNFASGPAVGTPTRVDLGGAAAGLIPGNTLPAQQFNFVVGTITDYLAAIRTAVSGIAVDGVAGGTYTLTNPLIFDGDAVQIDGIFDIASGGQGQVSSGGLFTINPGGVVDVISGGTVEFNASEDLKIDAVSNVWRLTMTPQSASLVAGIPMWQPVSPGVGGFVQTSVAAQYTISFPINLPVGDTITEVNVRINGGVGAGHSSLPAGTDRLRVSLVRVDTDGVVTTEAALFDPSASVGAYDVGHLVTLTNGAVGMTGTMPVLVDDDFNYYIVVAGEQGANAVANTTVVTSIFGDCIATVYRSFLMTY
jgi:hypothetical protein